MSQTNWQRPFRLLILTLSILSLPAVATAAGTIDGVVLNGLNGMPVQGVSLAIEGTDLAFTTDLDGLFRGEVPAGTHVVTVSKESYETQQVTDVVVADGDVASFSVVLMPGAEAAAAAGEVGEVEGTTFAETITVTTEVEESSESAILLERKQAAEIADLIGEEEFAKNPGGDAAGVLMRVTGVSVQDGKYVYVRGLGDRYSNTTLNGSKMPSTEFEKKVVPLDLFPADLLDKVAVSKSYRVDKPGEFAAGSVDMVTKNFPARQTLSLGLSFGQNSETTGEDFLTAAGGLSSSGSGGQPLPGSIPTESLVRFSNFTGEGFTPEELEGFGEQLVGAWTPTGAFDRTSFDEGDPELGFDLGYGNTFDKLGVVIAATSSNDFSNRFEERNFYSVAGGRLIPNENYSLDYSTEEVKSGLVGNFSYAFSGNNRLELRSVLTNLSSSEGRFQEGFFSDLADTIRDYRISYQDQEIENLQLHGEHFLPEAFAAGSLLEWRFGESTATTEENRRQTLYLQGTGGQYFLTDNAQSGFMFFNDLEDDLTEMAVDWSTFLSGKVTGTVKFGFNQTQNDRVFDARRLRFFHRNVSGIDLTLPADETFTAENIGPDGFELEEITRATDSYDGDHEVTAFYGMVDAAWGNWRLIGGVRFEDSALEVLTLDRTDPDQMPITTVLDESETPFSLSLVRKLRDDMNLRFVVSETLNRPSFRELAPFTYTHIVGGYAVQGNPELVSATISSFDARWEWFPAPTEVIAASIFFKDFDQPIERVVIPGAEFLETFANARSAENFGFELEARRRFGSSPFTGVLNFTWVDSEISVDPDLPATNSTRPLVGQPDTVLNAVLEWDRPESGSLIRLLFNQTGDKVGLAGSFGLPDVIEESRDTIDLTYIQRFAERFKVKLSARNLTDERWQWTQGGEPFRGFDKGRSLSLGLSWNL